MGWKVVTIFKLFPLGKCCMGKMGKVTVSLLEANTSAIGYSCQKPTNYFYLIFLSKHSLQLPEVSFFFCGMPCLGAQAWRSSCFGYSSQSLTGNRSKDQKYCLQTWACEELKRALPTKVVFFIWAQDNDWDLTFAHRLSQTAEAE